MRLIKFKKLSILPVLAFFAMNDAALSSNYPEPFDKICPSISTADIETMANGGLVWDQDACKRHFYYTAVDSNAASNMRAALPGMVPSTVFSPKHSSVRNYDALGDVCIYTVRSNGIEEIWVRQNHVAFPEAHKMQLADVERMEKGENVFPGFEYERTSEDLISFIKTHASLSPDWNEASSEPTEKQIQWFKDHFSLGLKGDISGKRQYFITFSCDKTGDIATVGRFVKIASNFNLAYTGANLK
jgi:hypothetical protein